MTEKTVLQEKLIQAREEKEQLIQRIKILEDQIKRIKTSQVSNFKFPEHLEKVISILSVYIYFVLCNMIMFFFIVATFLREVPANR